MSLRLKFNLVMVTVMALGLVLAWFLAEDITRREAKRSVLAQAAAIMGTANAVRHYTGEQVRPLLASQMEAQFLPQSVPFFAAQQTFQGLTEKFPEYVFRLPTNNPTNPADEPSKWEAKLIAQFAEKPALREIVVEREEQGRELLSYAQPITVSDKSCLQCHSTPAAAPPSMIDTYGSSNGFGWTLGDTIGAQVVSVSKDIPRQRARENLLHMMTALAGIFGVMLVVVNLLLHFSIVRPVQRMSRLADEISMGDMTAPEFAASGGNEIGSLGVSFNRMRRSLVTAMAMLGD
jgi:protein-histidine pros-kinase